MTYISKPFTQLVMALTLVLGLVVASAQPAEARGGRGIAAGIVIGAVGAAIIASEIRRDRRERRRWRRAKRRHYNRSYRHRSYRASSACYRGPERCGWVGNRRCWYNRYDERVCRGGRYKCWRETICD